MAAAAQKSMAKVVRACGEIGQSRLHDLIEVLSRIHRCLIAPFLCPRKMGPDLIGPAPRYALNVLQFVAWERHLGRRSG
jgi:hypothetical protein